MVKEGIGDEGHFSNINKTTKATRVSNKEKWRLRSSILFPQSSLLLVIKGSCNCPLSSLQIVQRLEGQVQGKSRWVVSVTNHCNCPQSQILLSCRGFQTVEGINPTILAKQGDNCLLFNGHTLNLTDIDQFEYAWDPSFPFVPISSVTGSPCRSQNEIQV
ncbi:hypothetical protein P8452_07295 [Trifolium repens]|nr:hypothetical protein P8452_07295 [Trifolium repens]